MPINETKLIWRNGEMIPWAEATTHILTHGLHYGTSVFEGMRAYDTKHKGVCIFRNREHFERFHYSARVYRIDMPHSVDELMQACRDVVRENDLSAAYIRDMPHSVDELMQACRDVVRENDLSAAYIRPVAFLGYGEMGWARHHAM